MDDPYKKSLLERECVKCALPDGVIIRPDGVHELDPFVYETIEIHRNVTVEILRCKIAGIRKSYGSVRKTPKMNLSVMKTNDLRIFSKTIIESNSFSE